MSDKKPVSAKQRFLLALIVLVLIAGGGVGLGLFREKYAESPRYSLTQLTGAVTSKDWSEVERYIDVEAVASNYMETLLANVREDGSAEDAAATLGREGVKDNGGGMGGSGAGADAATMNPVFVQKFRDSLRDGVESGSLRADAGGLVSVLLGKKPKDVKYESADVALVDVEVPAADGDTQVITLRMERSGALWRITAVENLDDLLGPLN